ncbi:MAG: hypothetical protein HGA36_02245 [Candidatus Moranbacteria bacterium]|nr:hypothetical protein [Candidatus Moranbacteria bacterium]
MLPAAMPFLNALLKSKSLNTPGQALNPLGFRGKVDIDQTKIENVDAMVGVQSAREAKEIISHVNKCLLGKIMCDGCCFTTDYIETLLQKAI